MSSPKVPVQQADPTPAPVVPETQAQKSQSVAQQIRRYRNQENRASTLLTGGQTSIGGKKLLGE